jgi:hypothetical protein
MRLIYQWDFCFKKFFKNLHRFRSFVFVKADQLFGNNDNQRDERTEALGFFMADVSDL